MLQAGLDLVRGRMQVALNRLYARVFVDDGGGYQVLWDDDPRLK